MLLAGHAFSWGEVRTGVGGRLRGRSTNAVDFSHKGGAPAHYSFWLFSSPFPVPLYPFFEMGQPDLDTVLQMWSHNQLLPYPNPIILALGLHAAVELELAAVPWPSKAYTYPIMLRIAFHRIGLMKKLDGQKCVKGCVKIFELVKFKMEKKIKM